MGTNGSTEKMLPLPKSKQKEWLAAFVTPWLLLLAAIGYHLVSPSALQKLGLTQQEVLSHIQFSSACRTCYSPDDS